MNNCINESCHKIISLSSHPGGYCSQPCWCIGEKSDMDFNKQQSINNIMGFSK